MGLLTNNDAKIFSQWFKECCRLRGISVKYVYPVTENVTIYSEIQPEFSDLIDLDILFDENPTVKTLKRIGWVSEDPEDKPAIAHLPIDTPYLMTKARILIPPIGQAIPGRWFEVTSIHSNLEYPDSYTVTLAPVFNSEKAKTNYEETNYNYVEDERANQPLEDVPNNDFGKKNFTFLKIDEGGNN